MFASFFTATRFLWQAAAGHRLRPWRRPYLRWRVETYSGKSAGSLTLGDFFRLAWAERRQMSRFALWLREMERLSHGDKV
jgi:hypothetical protein